MVNQSTQAKQQRQEVVNIARLVVLHVVGQIILRS